MAVKNKIPMRFFTMKGEEVGYDYFNKCFSTFDNLVLKANNVIPGGIDSGFIKLLLREGKYKQGGWMVKPDGSKIRLYYLIWLLQLLLMRDNAGFYLKDSQGKYVWKPKALEYYNTYKNNIRQQDETAENERRRRFLDNISRYDSDMKNDEDD